MESKPLSKSKESSFILLARSDSPTFYTQETMYQKIPTENQWGKIQIPRLKDSLTTRVAEDVSRLSLSWLMETLLWRFSRSVSIRLRRVLQKHLSEAGLNRGEDIIKAVDF